MTRSPKLPEEELILNADQVRCIASPVRSELMEAAVRLQRFSVNELAEKVGRNPKALYPHIRLMLEVGLIKQVDERLSGKRMEAVYAPTSSRLGIPRDNFSPEYRQAIGKKVQAVIRQTEREHMRYLDRATEEDLSISLRYFLRLTPGQISELKRKLMEVAQWANSVEQEEGSVEVSATFLAVPLSPSK